MTRPSRRHGTRHRLGGPADFAYRRLGIVNVALVFREADRLLVSGDAVITTRQVSAYAVALQKPEIHGPPTYLTPDRDAARESVQRLAAPEPEVIVAGHGRPMRGEPMRHALRRRPAEFDDVARPRLRRPRVRSPGGGRRWQGRRSSASLSSP